MPCVGHHEAMPCVVGAGALERMVLAWSRRAGGLARPCCHVRPSPSPPFSAAPCSRHPPIPPPAPHRPATFTAVSTFRSFLFPLFPVLSFSPLSSLPHSPPFHTLPPSLIYPRPHSPPSPLSPLPCSPPFPLAPSSHPSSWDISPSPCNSFSILSPSSVFPRPHSPLPPAPHSPLHPHQPESRIRDFLKDDCRVLVVGAGGLGCELLKDLVLSGFGSIDVIDMDTIDVSNLNRQFLFSPADVGKPKAVVAAERVMSRVGGVQVTPHFCCIEDKPASFNDFNIIVLGLDSLEARSYINSLVCGFLEYSPESELHLTFISGNGGLQAACEGAHPLFLHPSCPTPVSAPSCPTPVSAPSCPTPVSAPSCPTPVSAPSPPEYPPDGVASWKCSPEGELDGGTPPSPPSPPECSPEGELGLT
ncbi:unnamed protein product, partial [Closterium sp. Naga37s-1]